MSEPGEIPVPSGGTSFRRTGTVRPAEGSTLRLLSYNIQTGIAITRYRHYLTQSWKHVLPFAERQRNMERIARLVGEYDVVGLQEVDAGSLRSDFINQVGYLAQSARFPYWYHRINRRLGKLAQHSLGLLSRVRLADIQEHRLPGAIPGRGAIIARFGDGMDSLVLMIVHLALGRRARLRQIDYLGEIVSCWPHVILMGDMNCRSESREMERLVDRSGLSEPAHGLHTFPSWRPRKNIDHILVSPSLKVESTRVLPHPFSDHLPIAATVRVPPSVRLGGRRHPREAAAGGRAVGA